MMHIGQGLVCASKIQDLIQSGFYFIVFLADWHSMINNKYGGDLEKTRPVRQYDKHRDTALGLPDNFHASRDSSKGRESAVLLSPCCSDLPSLASAFVFDHR